MKTSSTRIWVTLAAMLVMLAALAMEIDRHSHAPAARPADTVHAAMTP